MDTATESDQPLCDNITTTYHGLGINDFNVKYGHQPAENKFSFKTSVKSQQHSANCLSGGLLTFVERRIPAVRVLHHYKVLVQMQRNGKMVLVAEGQYFQFLKTVTFSVMP
jgi:hypothetical protein